MLLSKSISNYIDDMEEVMKLLMKTMNDVDSMTSMTEDEFKLLQATIKLVNSSNDVLLEMGYILKRIDNKIDNLLSNEEERA